MNTADIFRKTLEFTRGLRPSLSSDTLPDAQNASPRDANFPVDPQDLFRKAEPFVRRLNEIKNKFKNTEVIIDNTQKKSLMAEISAYTADPEETDERPRETTTQTEVKEGRTIATNNEALLGKQIKVGDIIYLIEDLMGPRYREEFKKTGKIMFDIFKESRKEALEFGRQNLDVEILD